MVTNAVYRETPPSPPSYRFRNTPPGSSSSKLSRNTPPPSPTTRNPRDTPPPFGRPQNYPREMAPMMSRRKVVGKSATSPDSRTDRDNKLIFSYDLDFDREQPPPLSPKRRGVSETPPLERMLAKIGREDDEDEQYVRMECDGFAGNEMTIVMIDCFFNHFPSLYFFSFLIMYINCIIII